MLKWKDRGTDENGKDSTARIGGIELSCVCNLRVYKDGTRQYMIYLSVPSADSKEIITVTKVRGYLADAKAKAEEFVQRLKEDLLPVLPSDSGTM